jgi:hypothetical protein
VIYIGIGIGAVIVMCLSIISYLLYLIDSNKTEVLVATAKRMEAEAIHQAALCELEIVRGRLEIAKLSLCTLTTKHELENLQDQPIEEDEKGSDISDFWA